VCRATGKITVSDLPFTGRPIGGKELRVGGGEFADHHDMAERPADAGFVVARHNQPGHSTMR
jgi:hypothetical protein